MSELYQSMNEVSNSSCKIEGKTIAKPTIPLAAKPPRKAVERAKTDPSTKALTLKTPQELITFDEDEDRFELSKASDF